jgi:hypothetical protein
MQTILPMGSFHVTKQKRKRRRSHGDVRRTAGVACSSAGEARHSPARDQQDLHLSTCRIQSFRPVRGEEAGRLLCAMAALKPTPHHARQLVSQMTGRRVRCSWMD